VRFVDQYDAPSSNESRTPPMGAPNAEAMPAAAPQATKSGIRRGMGRNVRFYE
jgi:hypothetical protein